MPILTVLEKITSCQVFLFFFEDNKASLDILRSGRNPTLRYMSRTQGVDMKWLHTVYMKDNVTAAYVPTTVVAADIYTKEYSDVHK